MAGSPLSASRELRERWYRLVEKEGWKVPRVCLFFGISTKTYYKWWKKDHGFSSKIHKPRIAHPQTKIVGRVRVVIVEAKEKFNYGPKKMSVYVQREMGIYLSPNAIYKFFKKKHLVRKPQKKQVWYHPLKEPFYATKPGENVQLDTKFVPALGGGWAYQFRFIDTVTRLQYATTLESKDARTTIRAFQAAERSFPFPIDGIQTDNGGEFRGVFHEFLVRRNITQRYIPKRSAPWNGKVERANRSVDDEYYLNYRRPWKTIHAYVHWYNHERPHLGKDMNGLTPYQKFLALAG